MSAIETSFSFSLREEREDGKLTLKNLDLLTLEQFTKDVVELIQGDHKKSAIAKTQVEILDGSVRVRAFALPVLVATTLTKDIQTLSQSLDLDEVTSSKRAGVFEKWQKASANSKNDRSYLIFKGSESSSPVLGIKPDLGLRHLSKDQWVRSELSLRGTVYDVGGKNKPNLHLGLPNGDSYKINATVEQLKGAGYVYEEMAVEWVESLRSA